MSFPVLIGPNNYQSGNLFKFSFPNIVDLNDFECSVSEMFLYYSWYNISAAANNNTFQIVIPTATPSTNTLILPVLRVVFDIYMIYLYFLVHFSDARIFN